MIETLTCPKCSQTLQSEKTLGVSDSKAVTCNVCKQKSLLGLWRVQLSRRIENEPASTIKTPPPLPGGDLDANVASVVQPLRAYFTIAIWVTGGGLLLTCLSPFFYWIRVGAFGMTGLAGDGKFLLAISILAFVAFFASFARINLKFPLLVCVQAWGIIVAFWMLALIIKASSIANPASADENAFVPLFAMLISPGIGLYIGLIGGFCVAGALGYLIAMQFQEKRSVKAFVAIESFAVCMGLVIAVLIGPSGFPKQNDTKTTKVETAVSKPTENEHVITAEINKPFKLGSGSSGNFGSDISMNSLLL